MGSRGVHRGAKRPRYLEARHLEFLQARMLAIEPSTHQSSHLLSRSDVSGGRGSDRDDHHSAHQFGG